MSTTQPGTSTATAPRTIGILGAGRVGTAVARQALQAGLEVKIATAKPVEEIELMVGIVVPGARAVTADEAVDADIVVVAVPLHRFNTVDPALLTGRTVIDAMNYWAPIDGTIDVFENDERTSSEIVAEHFAGAQIVKTLNHIGYHELETDGTPTGTAERRALALAGDHPSANAVVSTFIDMLGYDAVETGGLSSGKTFQPGTEIFAGRHTADEIREHAGLSPERLAA